MAAAALFVLPFSIAAGNTLLGTLLIASLLSGQWKKGLSHCWFNHRGLVIAILAWILLLFAGILWSSDPRRSFDIISNYWDWLLIPALLQVALTKRNRHLLAASLSAGLFLHLIASAGQSFGIQLPTGNGSNTADPAGFIGHIGFGLIYGIWSAWLLHIASRTQGPLRIASLTAAMFGIGMTFVVQGRSGWLVMIVLLLYIGWRTLGSQASRWKAAAILITSSMLLIWLAWGHISSRTEQTWNSLQTALSGDWQHAETRFSLWASAWECWMTNPWLGRGTSGYADCAHDFLKRHPEVSFDGSRAIPGHPHQMYLLTMARWGIAGLASLIILWWVWFRTGARYPDNPWGSAISLSALGLAVHGFSSSSMEEYYALMYGTIWLSLGLAGITPTPKEKGNAPD